MTPRLQDIIARSGESQSEHCKKMTSIKLNSPLQPDLDKLLGYLQQVNENAWYTNFGELHEEFARRLRLYFGVDNILLLNNGTTALQVAAKALKSQSALTTPYSFLATSAALDWQKVELQYADICEKSFNLNPEKVDLHLAKHRSVDTVVATHIYGNPCNVRRFQQVADEHNVKVLYDAAQCFGIKHGGRSIIANGDASIMSFHATKVFHSIEGGAIWFKDPEVFESASKMINFGLHNGEIASAGINGKLNEYQAAVGLVLLDGIDGIIDHRTRLYRRYLNNLHSHVTVQQWNSETTMNGGYFPIVLAEPDQCIRLQNYLLERNIETRQYFIQPLHKNYGSCTDICEQADDLIPRVLTMPLHAHMNFSDVDWICENVKNFLRLQ